MRTIFICVLVFLTIQLSVCAPLAGDPESVVPEEVLTEEEYAKRPPWDVIDDPSDAEAEKHPPVDPLGNNIITGQSVYKGHNGMVNDHLGVGGVKPPGYTTHDTATIQGHYYLGSGRRRIGAGFGRRRRVTEVPMSKKALAAQKKKMDAIFKNPSKMKALLKFAHQRMSSYGADLKNAKGKMGGMTRAQLEKFNREMFGLTHGPSLFEDPNYGGASVQPGKSVADMDTTGKVQNNDLSSLKVPPGWVVELFTKKNFKGQSIKFNGPVNVWSLTKKPLTVPSGSGSVHTTWENQVMSVKMTKYSFIAPLITTKCKLSCGLQKYDIIGKVFCQRSGGLQKKATVTSAKCTSLKLSKPMTPKKRCSATPVCVAFRTSKPTGKCTKTCGFAGNTLHGKVWCETRMRGSKDGPMQGKDWTASPLAVTPGTHVKNQKCFNQSLKKPKKPSKKCPKTARCVKWVRKFPRSCPTGCGKSASKIQSVNTCHAALGGAKVSSKECNNWKLAAPGTKTKSCSKTGPCAVKKKCKVSSINGFSDYAWDPQGRYCYKINFGKWVQQDWAHSKSKCNARQFHSNVYIGRYNGNAHYYPNGDSRSCPGGKKRTVSVELRQDPNVAATTAKVTEPQVCAYKMVITRKSCP